MNLGHCGCSSERALGLGAVDQNGFVTIGGLGQADTTNSLVVDVGIGLAAFLSLVVYDTNAPKKWPHPKKLWQQVVIAGGLYFGGSYLYRKVL